MSDDVVKRCVESIHQCGRQFVLAATGGGTSAISTLLASPGGSRSMLEALAPYSAASLEHFLGGSPDQACSDSTARAMAMAAWMRARRLAPEEDPSRLIGVACTASLATDRPKRGDHRIYVAVQALTCTQSCALVFADKLRPRAEQEMLAARLTIYALAKRCGQDVAPIKSQLQQVLGTKETIVEHGAVGDPAACELISGARHWTALRPRTIEAELDAEASRPQGLIFPGSFNPPHEGHLRMASIAEARTGRRLAWEVSVVNVDKPMLDYVSIQDRVQQLRWKDPHRLILLSTAPTYREKARYFAGSIFVVGADTMSRIGDPRYYDDDASRRDAAIADVAEADCRFLVFGRTIGGQFRTCAELDLPPALAALCDEVSVDEFREDVSSRELRAGSLQTPTA